MGVDEVMSQTQAWKAYDRWKQDERVSFIDEPPNLELVFRSLSRQSSPNPKNWADAYLGAFAIASDMHFVTFDQAFRGKLENLLILQT
jgi:predicted nucleic acid-binding protein